MAALDQEAALDGGDVLYTGRHVLVGRSARTNDAGIAVLRKVMRGMLMQVSERLMGLGERARMWCTLTANMILDRHHFIPQSFPDTPVVVIPVPPPLLHLKCLISAIDREHLVIAETYRDQLCKHLPVDADGECAYTIITVPDVISSNVLAIPARKTVLVQQGYPRSEAIIRQALAADNWHVVPLLMSENVKADGALTCLSVFVPSQFEA